MARKIEMHWVCSACQTRNLGRHKTCTRCGDPKDASEPWLMPSDTKAAPTVRDPELLRQANAGADWQCGYCGAHQRRLDGRCARCGAQQAAGSRVPEGGARRSAMRAFGGPAGAPAAPVRKSTGKHLLLSGCMFTLFSCLSCIGLGALLPDPPPPVLHKPASSLGVVSGLTWRRIAHVERLQIVRAEGFVEDRPADAFDIESLGQAHHHDEDVFDHYETQHYTEQVPYQDTETYTEQERCGEDCTSTPQSCTEVCTPDNNGFASCRNVCSGGGQSCSPRYCSVTRTRSVTRYRTEPRTRQVPVTRSEPRYAERFAWHAWRWRHARDVQTAGTQSEEPRWPAAEELAAPEPLAEGERERVEREERYHVDFDVLGVQRGFELSSLSEYERYTAGDRWFLSRDGARIVKPVSTFPSVDEPTAE